MTQRLSQEEQKLTYALFCDKHIKMNGSIDDFLQKTQEEIQTFISGKEAKQILQNFNTNSLIHTEVFPLGVTFLYNGDSSKKGDYYSFMRHEFGNFRYLFQAKNDTEFKMWRNNLLIDPDEKERYRQHTIQLSPQYINHLLRAHEEQYPTNPSVLEYV